MEYKVHGNPVVHDGRECGIYKPIESGIALDYAVLNVEHFFASINAMPPDEAVTEVTNLRDLAATQAEWNETPRPTGAPLLQMTNFTPTPIDEARPKIENTVSLANKVLKALEGN